MNLIIEAGGTKSNLVFVENGEIISSFVEGGVHLSRESTEDFEKRVHRWSELQPVKIQTVFLFAAGKINVEKKDRFIQILSKGTDGATIEIHSDLLAACYATAGNEKGIVGILGTGSNSCFYDGKSIVKNVAPGGFILGDEGSGSDIGKKILIDYLRNAIPLALRKQLEDEFKLTSDLVIQNIYGGTIKDAVDFCSRLSSFVISNHNDDYCNEICRCSVYAYLELIKNAYTNNSDQLYLVGSVAFYLQGMIKAESLKKDIELIKIIQHPIKDLSLFLVARYGL